MELLNNKKPTWNEYFFAARHYQEANGDLLVPVSFIDKNGLKLGQWIKEKIELLESIGMVWNPLGAQWERNYAQAKLFFEKNGHLCVPKNYVTENGIKLRPWIAN